MQQLRWGLCVWWFRVKQFEVPTSMLLLQGEEARMTEGGTVPVPCGLPTDRGEVTWSTPSLWSKALANHKRPHNCCQSQHTLATQPGVKDAAICWSPCPTAQTVMSKHRGYHVPAKRLMTPIEGVVNWYLRWSYLVTVVITSNSYIR